ncbi:hypothetical protein QJ48_06785 [Paenibacillus sp. A3]|uniref:hypothetical protein n=1 Tax=Paenibacillus sp. A3 TaxID=1337054 RepID=UPI0006D5ADEC|nr:hypothetical protein [Paenibacillus sp. A3]KPV60212.1 hypothetical protein QJ48_06785 [Paenibacillus sp. A3]
MEALQFDHGAADNSADADKAPVLADTLRGSKLLCRTASKAERKHDRGRAAVMLLPAFSKR